MTPSPQTPINNEHEAALHRLEVEDKKKEEFCKSHDVSKKGRLSSPWLKSVDRKTSGSQTHLQTLQVERPCLKQVLSAIDTQFGPLENDFDDPLANSGAILHGPEGHSPFGNRSMISREEFPTWISLATESVFIPTGAVWSGSDKPRRRN